MWQAFVQWFIEIIKLIYGFTEQIGLPSYGLAIIFMTIAIKLVMFPLTQQQMRSMRGMQEIQPKMKYIQEKFKDDPQLMQKKIMELYKEHGVNPMGGCLPLIIQMPIFIALYQSLMSMSKTVFHDSPHAGFLWISNIGLSVKELVAAAPGVLVIILIFVLPILSALTTYLQQRISMVESNDPTQKAMLYFMPLMMAYITYTVPAGLGIYWISFNILGILQQLYVNRIHSRPRPAAISSLEAEELELPVSDEPAPKSEGGKEKVAQRDKGGKEKDAGSNSRKKRKKR